MPNQTPPLPSINIFLPISSCCSFSVKKCVCFRYNDFQLYKNKKTRGLRQKKRKIQTYKYTGINSDTHKTVELEDCIYVFNSAMNMNTSNMIFCKPAVRCISLLTMYVCKHDTYSWDIL